MESTYPLVHIYNQSKIMSELLRSFIITHCNRYCIFIDDFRDAHIRNKTVFILCDLQNLETRNILGTENDSFYSPTDAANVLYVVSNIVKGEEDRLIHCQHRQRIRGLFYIDDDLKIFQKGFTAILNNEIWVPRTVLMTWMNKPGNKSAAKYQDVLSLREMSILQLIIGGRSNKEVSRELYISANTVKAHLYNIYKKIEVSNRLQAAIWASHHISEENADKN